MKLKKELKTLLAVVEGILQEHPAARENDATLYGWVLNAHGISVDTSYRTLTKLILEHKVPTMESVGRARRKVQENNSALCPAAIVQKLREQAEKEYKEFNRETKIGEII